MSTDKIRVLLVDDHTVLRNGLRVLLEAEDDIEVIGEAANGTEAVELAFSIKPDVAVVDLGLPDIDGFEVIRRIKENESLSMNIVVLSMHTSRQFVVKAIEAGSAGYVPKSSTHDSLLDAIRVVYSGERYLHPVAASALVKSYMEEGSDEEKQFNELTSREQEVIRFTAFGYNSREIGEKLIISPKTVDTYRQRAFEKLGIEHKSDLMRFVIRMGLFDDLGEANHKKER